jgi:hypothetical protein
MTRWMNGLAMVLLVVLAAGLLFGCGQDDLGALLVRWPL